MLPELTFFLVNLFLKFLLNQPLTIIIIGGGAAGFFAAIRCAESAPDHRVILLEASQQLLAKVKISGGGRCNVTHDCFSPALFVQNYPRGGKALRGAFSRFQARDTVNWFEQRGVALKTEADGRMFPVTDDSATIANCLIAAAKSAGVEIKTGAGVTSVDKLSPSTSFKLNLRNGEVFTCDRLLIATGSNPLGYRWAKALGHTIISPVPSLFTFNIRDQRLQGLAGIAVPTVQVKLPAPQLSQTGPLLITHWGVSGPAILKLSAWGARFLYDHHYQTELWINWVPEIKADVVRQQLLQLKTETPRRFISSTCPFPLPRRLWQQLIDHVNLTETRWAELSKKSLHELVQELTQGCYQIQGKGIFKEEFVTCGGVNLKEVNFQTMESRCCPGLYFAGEILDIDGITGGFNFQSAWTTGALAGSSMATM